MLIACPKCGSDRTNLDVETLRCGQCRRPTPLSQAAVAFLGRAKEIWPEATVLLKSQRATRLIKEHDDWLKEQQTAQGDSWFNVISSTLGAVKSEDEGDGIVWDSGSDAD